MLQTIRLFLAAPVPEELKVYLHEQAARYHHEAIRLIPDANLHLTLYFIGNVAAERLPEIKEVTTHLAQQFGPFTLQLEAIEPGPKPRSPRLVWARFQQQEAFTRLSHALTVAIGQRQPDERKAIPHITLARFRKDRPAPHGLPQLLPEHPVTLPVSEVAIWHSELASPHPRYSIMHRYPLSGNP